MDGFDIELQINGQTRAYFKSMKEAIKLMNEPEENFYMSDMQLVNNKTKETFEWHKDGYWANSM